MVKYAIRDELKDKQGRVTATERLHLIEKAESYSAEKTTFLSHSSNDTDWFLPAIDLLEEHGAKIYIDKKDPELPPYTDTETAKKLRTQIRQSQKFILLASTNSMDSKWVPWELGLADGCHARNNIALFPALDKQNERDWVSNEYFGLYRKIVFGAHESYSRDVWMVLDTTTNKGTELSKWLG